MSSKLLKTLLSSSLIATAASMSSSSLASGYNEYIIIPASSSTTVTATPTNVNYSGSGTLVIDSTGSTNPIIMNGVEMGSVTGSSGIIKILAGSQNVSLGGAWTVTSPGSANYISTANTLTFTDMGGGVLLINNEGITVDNAFNQYGGVVGVPITTASNNSTLITGNYNMLTGLSGSIPQLGCTPNASGWNTQLYQAGYSYSIGSSGTLAIGIASNPTPVAVFAVYGNPEAGYLRGPFGQINLNKVDATYAGSVMVKLGFFPNNWDLVPLSYQQDVSTTGPNTFVQAIQNTTSNNGDVYYLNSGGYVVLPSQEVSWVSISTRANSFPTYLYNNGTISYSGISTADQNGNLIGPDGAQINPTWNQEISALNENIISGANGSGNAVLVIKNAQGVLTNGSGNSFFAFRLVPQGAYNGLYGGTYPVGVFFDPNQVTAWYNMLIANGLPTSNQAASTMYQNMKGYAQSPMYYGYTITSQEVVMLGYQNISTQVAYFNHEASPSSQTSSNRSPEASRSTSTSLASMQAVSTTSHTQTSSMIGARQFANMANEEGGVASGDSADKGYGLWVHAIGGIANQKMSKGMTGYKTKSFGGVFGVDTKVSEKDTVGAVFSRIDSILKHQDFKNGDKTKTTSYLFGLYGTHLFDNPFIIQGNILFGKNYITMRELHPVNAQGVPTTSYSKYNNYAYSVEVLGGYRFQATDQLELRPMIGAQYHYASKVKYNEDSLGRATKNITVKGKNTVTGIFGGSVTLRNHFSEGNILHTSLHGFVLHDFINKTPRAKIVNSETNVGFISDGAPSSATTYRLGTDITLERGNIEYGIRYDADIAKKYIGHSGILKLKLKL